VIRRGTAALCLGLVLGAAAGCGAPAPGVTIFAAASLRDVIEPLARETAQRSGEPVRFSFAASSTLARQIDSGAPADIFISAHPRWMDWLAGREALVAGTRVAPIGNALVLVAGPGEAARWRDRSLRDILASLGPARRLALGDPAHVPAGIYAREALETLGLWQDDAEVYAFVDNVRAALALVARGETPFGFVYATDAALEPGVDVLARVEPGLHTPIVYTFAIVEGGERPAVRTMFRALTDASALQRYAAAGFTTP
jgi:molybdate transport system substrate-binding protein